MQVDKKLIENVAKVARLNLTDSEIEKFAPQLDDVMQAFSSLQQIDTQGVVPSFHPIPLQDAVREDTLGECLSQEEALSLTQHKKDGYFRGPKAV